MTNLTFMRKHSNFLKRLVKASSKSELRKIILKATSPQVKLLVGLVYNALKGNIQLTPKLKQIGRRHQKSLRHLIESCCSATKRGKNKIHMKPSGVAKARRLIANQSGGLPPFVIPLAGLAGSLIWKGAKALYNRFKSK